MCEQSEIRRCDVRFESAALAQGNGHLHLTLDALEGQHIAGVLADEGGSVVRAAKRLGITRNTLYYKLRKHGITLHKESKRAFE